MISLALCDDSKTELEKISNLVKTWAGKRKDETISISLFSSPYHLVEAVSRGAAFDIFLLDILMPEMTGISLGEKLRNLLEEPLLIYLTSSEDYYPDAFRLYAFQYLCKPFRKSDFIEVMDRAMNRCIRRKVDVFTLKTSDGILQIPIHTIVYVELHSHICHFYLANGTNLKSQYLRTSFDHFMETLLQHGQFIKTHAAYIVNLDYAGKLSSGSLTLVTGVSIPVTRTFASHVQQCYMEHALNEEVKL